MLLTKTMTAVVASLKTKTLKPKALYLGPDLNKKRHRIKNKNGQKMLLAGAAYELVSRVDDNGKRVNKRILIAVTPGWVASPDTDVSFLARVPKSAMLVRLIGTVEVLQEEDSAVLHNKNNATQTTVTGKATDAAAEHLAVPPATSKVIGSTSAELANKTLDVSVGKPASQPLALTDAELAVFKRELEVINAQRAAGFDPNVRVATAGIMSNRSHASMYRDIKKAALPKPTKIGSRSFFPLSVVLAYVAGQLVGGAA